MNVKKDYNEVIKKLDDVIDNLDSIRGLVDRSSYELESNVICGKTCDNGNSKIISENLLEMVNDLEILKSKYEINNIM